jgi:hypothetical protein
MYAVTILAMKLIPVQIGIQGHPKWLEHVPTNVFGENIPVNDLISDANEISLT